MIGPSFQEANQFLMLSVENITLPTVKAKDYQVNKWLLLRTCYVTKLQRKFSDQHLKKLTKRYENIVKFYVDDYLIVRLSEYSHFREHFKPIAVDLSKPKALAADAGAIQ